MLCKFTIVLIVLDRHDFASVAVLSLVAVYMRPAWKSAETCLRSFRQLNRNEYLQTGRFSSCKHKLTSLTCSHMLIMLYDGKTFARSFILVSCKHSNNCGFHAGLTSCWSHVNTAPDNCKFPIKVKLLAPLSMQFAKCCIQNDYLCPI